MKVLYLVNGPGFSSKAISGGDIRVVEIAKRLKKLGVDVSVLTTTAGYKILEESGLKTDYCKIAPPKWLGKVDCVSIGYIFSYIFEAIKSISIKAHFSRYEIVISTSDFLCDTIPAWYYTWRNPDAKWIAVVHHLYDTPWRRKGDFASNILGYLSQQVSFRLIRNRADLVFVYDSPQGRRIRRLLSKIGFSRENVRLVRNGINLDVISGTPEQNKVFDACFVASLRKSKGIFDLVAIWRQICEKRKNATLAIIGTGAPSDVKALKREIKNCGLSDNVKLLGYISHSEDLFKFLKSSKFFMFPSYEEGWGIAVCEAMACGLPVIAYDLPTYRIFGNAIIRVPKGNKEVFAEAALKLLSSEKLRMKLGEEAENIASRFDWDVVAKRELALFGELLGKERDLLINEKLELVK